MEKEGLPIAGDTEARKTAERAIIVPKGLLDFDYGDAEEDRSPDLEDRIKQAAPKVLTFLEQFGSAEEKSIRGG